MPRSALPPNYVIGPDNQSWLMRLKKKVQIWLATGPRASGFWKWRDIPELVFIMKGRGLSRWEDTNGQRAGAFSVGSLPNDAYLSRIQPWRRWHIALQWPLYFQFHVIYRQKNVVKWPKYQSDFGICKMLTGGIGFKRDGDKIYWLTCNFGGNFE